MITLLTLDLRKTQGEDYEGTVIYKVDSNWRFRFTFSMSAILIDDPSFLFFDFIKKIALRKIEETEKPEAKFKS